MVTVTIRETYDLSTNTNKMGLLAIHTPSVKLLKRLYPGLLLSHRFMRPEKCDIALAAASLLPADPLQVGTETGDIAPQDLFNPILYRTVSTDSFNTIMNRAYGYNRLNSLTGGAVSDSGLAGSSAFTQANSTDVYYGLLSESGWKKAMPQTGLVMRDVVPLVYEVLNTFGNAYMPENASSLNYEDIVSQSGAGVTAINNIAQTFRGKAHPMPRIPTIKSMEDNILTGFDTTDDWSVPAGKCNEIPKVPCVLIVMPPAKLHKLFFRMTVSWTITFSEVCSIVERGMYGTINNAGAYTHTMNYAETTAKMDDSAMTTKEDMVDTVDVNAEMIMQA